MKTQLVGLIAVLAVAGGLMVACSAPAAAPAQPTSAPKTTEATKAPSTPPTATTSQPTAAPAAQATAAPAAKKVDFPQKGKAVNLIVGYPAGGANDVAARLTAPLLEKELGIPVSVSNKAGAGSQVGMTELVNSKPDGYTIGQTVLAPVITSYLDPERKAVYTRKNFTMIGNHYTFPIAISVKSDSPYKTIKDVVDAAKAEPGKVKAGTTGILSNNHLVGLQLQKLTDIKFSYVHFDGGAPELTALLGGHIDVAINPLTEVVAQFKAGQIRVLGITDKDEVSILPGVKTLQSQGYPVLLSASTGYAAPPSTPKEILDVLSAAFKKSVDDQETTKKMVDLGYVIKYLNPEQYDAFWADLENQVAPLMPLAKEN